TLVVQMRRVHELMTDGTLAPRPAEDGGGAPSASKIAKTVNVPPGTAGASRDGHKCWYADWQRGRCGRHCLLAGFWPAAGVPLASRYLPVSRCTSGMRCPEQLQKKSARAVGMLQSEPLGLTTMEGSLQHGYT